MMKNRILWIEDDFHAIKGLVRPLEKDGFAIDVAPSAVAAFEKAQQWRSYDLIMVDLILPISDGVAVVPEVVKQWDRHEYVGIALVKWLLMEIKAECPVLILSIVRDPISRYGLEDLGLAGSLAKGGLVPSTVKDEVLQLLRRRDS